MPSFDIVSQVDKQEVKNAVEQANKEVSNRFDFKGSDARIEQAELALTVFADDEFKLGQVTDVLRGRMAKRNIDVRCLEVGALEKISGDKVKRLVTVKVGIATDNGKRIQKLIKDAKLKGAGLDPGRRRARAGRQERRSSGGDSAGAGFGRRHPAAVHQFPRLSPSSHWS